MKFMVIIKASKSSEAGQMPSTELLTAMGKYNEELVRAGIMLAGEGLHPSSQGARVRFHECETRCRFAQEHLRTNVLHSVTSYGTDID